MDTAEGGSKRALTVTVVLVCVIAYAAVKTYHARRSFDRLRKQGLVSTTVDIKINLV